MKQASLTVMLITCVLLAGCVSRTSGPFSRANDNRSYVLCASAGQPIAADNGDALQDDGHAIAQPCNPKI